MGRTVQASPDEVIVVLATRVRGIVRASTPVAPHPGLAHSVLGNGMASVTLEHVTKRFGEVTAVRDVN
ncbi:MAG: hypothetical protein EBS89_11035, partial [Proteobacteria bacterium]|nr:hypothetical protein [Pseudomonadota bacterium]